jgi:ubiquinone/menaquinone biosynthesis C-methylase UbiE
VCPVERAGGLDNRFRAFFQNPRRIILPYVSEGMSVLDAGCGPGFFSVEMARLVGASGRVYACDLQEGMLDRVRAKVKGTGLASRIVLHKCSSSSIGLSESVDFALAFYMLHELPDQRAFFLEVLSLLRPGGRLLVVEPPFHVSKASFSRSIGLALDVGFSALDCPGVAFSRTALLGPA